MSDLPPAYEHKIPDLSALGAIHIDDYRKQMESRAISVIVISDDESRSIDHPANGINEYLIGYDGIIDALTQIKNFLLLMAPWVLEHKWVPKKSDTKFYQKKQKSKDLEFSVYTFLHPDSQSKTASNLIENTFKTSNIADYKFITKKINSVINFDFTIANYTNANKIKMVFKIYSNDQNELESINQSIGRVYSVIAQKDVNTETYYDFIDRLI